MKKQDYVIIGGQYYYHDYGTAATLVGAKRIAGKNAEYWDNWQGWMVPRIYSIKDVIHDIDNDTYYPDDGARPVAIASYNNGHITWYDMTREALPW